MPPRLPPLFWRLTRNQRGVTLVEYGLLVALLSVVMAGALNTLGPAIQAVLSASTNAMN